MKFNFKIQQYQTEAVDAIVRVFNGQPNYDRTTYIRDLGKPQANQQMQLAMLNDDDDDIMSDTGYKNEVIELTDAQLLDNIRIIQSENNIKTSDKLAHDMGRCSLDIEMETGERVIIVTGCINALLARISGDFIENNSCIS